MPKAGNYELDMCNGPLFPKIVLFSIPLILTGILQLLYNAVNIVVVGRFIGSDALAAVGSTTALINLIINLFIGLSIGAGVLMARYYGCVRLQLRKIRFYKDKLVDILKIGLPAGMQGTIFNISNVLIQSSVNSFGSTVMAGNTAAMNIESFVYVSMNSIYQTALNFTGQNVGAKKYDRVGRILGECLATVTTVGVIMGGLSYLFAQQLLGIYSTDPEVISVWIIRLAYICLPYFLCGVMDVMVGSLRGMGYSMLPMLSSVIGVCGIRITWIYTVFAANHSLQSLYFSYAIS